MKHFSTEEWVDFVNQVIASNQREAMQKHLATGCKRCMETVSLWQKVSKTAAAEASYQPPADTVRLAKAAYLTTAVKYNAKGIAQPDRSAVRQLPAASRRRSPFGRNRNKTNAL